MAGKHGAAATAKLGPALGERVRAARKARGLSQAQLAGEELTKGFISQLESGLVRPSVRSLQLIASRLDRPLDYFLGDEAIEAGKRVSFHLLAAEAAIEQGDVEDGQRHVTEALAIATDRVGRARCLAVVAQAEYRERSFERCFELVDEGLRLVEVASHPHLVASFLYLRGSAYGELGQMVAAADALEAAHDTIERYEVLDPRLRSRVLVSLGTAYRRLQRGSRALSAYGSALATALRGSELVLAARGHMGIAATHYDSGEMDAAIASYQRAVELFRRASDIDLELNALQSIATVQLENGDVAAARTSAERALARAREVDDPRWAAVVEVTLARVALRSGDAAEALRRATEAADVLATTTDAVNYADALGARGAALEALGRSAEADDAYRSSIDLYTATGDLADRAGMATEYARALRARGEVDRAFEMLELARR